MSTTLTSRVEIVGFTPALAGSAAAEATVVDQGPGLERTIDCFGPDSLLVHDIKLDGDGHTLAPPTTVEPGGTIVVRGLTKLASKGRSSVRISSPTKPKAVTA